MYRREALSALGGAFLVDTVEQMERNRLRLREAEAQPTTQD